ncbi:MAG: glycoside hydrolase family 97 catalytic domain-containing protein [Bacteroidaceae bacterium]|nr:glycoside hydrolase family 97 catalytic domain-containing protein [Bacteroidaceae bacterium]
MHQMKKLVLAAGMLVCAAVAMAKPVDAVSPNGKLALEQQGNGYVISCNGQQVLNISQVGITTSTVGEGLTFQRIAKRGKVKADYLMKEGKRLHPTNVANEYVCEYTDQNGKPVQLVFRLYNDGVAFRYELSGLEGEQLKSEQTVYTIPEGTRRWMQKWSDGYEEFFPLTTSGGGRDKRLGFPSLLEPQEGTYVLLTEANIERNQSAASLYNDGKPEDYRVCPDQNEVSLDGNWHTPWRIAIIGSLADVVESTLVTDVSEPCKLKDTSWIHSGVVSWVYWAYNHGSNDYNIIKMYVDFAAQLKLPYVLIDAEWDEMKDGKSVVDAVNYAKSQGIKPLIWYNSSVGWVNGAPGPKYRLNKPEDREKEFAWCEEIGVAGVKIDFFSGDNQMNMDYCIDLMECAARHHLLVNFHGAPIPRGWQRTYPNLLATEGVYGAEWYNNVPTFTNRAAAHNATLPFTRNVIGPMDYTPCAFSDSQHPHITTHAHELALTVLFESGLQHLADRPQSFLAQPQEVQDFLSELPAAWDDTRLVAGEPGEYAVIARRKGNTWYVAGINGSDEPRTIAIKVDFIKTAKCDILSFADSGESAAPWNISNVGNLPHNVSCQPRGGFLYVIKKK